MEGEENFSQVVISLFKSYEVVISSCDAKSYDLWVVIMQTYLE